MDEHFLSFLEEAMTWWGNEKQKALLFNLDAMVTTLAFLLEEVEEDRLQSFLVTIRCLVSNDVLNCALGNVATLGPFQDYYASIGEAGETASRIREYDEMSELNELNGRQVVALFNMVALIQHVEKPDVPWRQQMACNDMRAMPSQKRLLNESQPMASPGMVGPGGALLLLTFTCFHDSWRRG